MSELSQSSYNYNISHGLSSPAMIYTRRPRYTIPRQTVSWKPGYLRYWAVLLQTARSHRDMTGFALGLDRFVTSGIFFWSPHFSRLRVHVLTKGLTEGWWDSLDTVWTQFGQGWTRWDQCSASERQFAVATNINWYWQAPLCCSIRFNWWWSYSLSIINIHIIGYLTVFCFFENRNWE